jgi:hypothetical protein
MKKYTVLKIDASEASSVLYQDNFDGVDYMDDEAVDAALQDCSDYSEGYVSDMYIVEEE